MIVSLKLKSSIFMVIIELKSAKCCIATDHWSTVI